MAKDLITKDGKAIKLTEEQDKILVVDEELIGTSTDTITTDVSPSGVISAELNDDSVSNYHLAPWLKKTKLRRVWFNNKDNYIITYLTPTTENRTLSKGKYFINANKLTVDENIVFNFKALNGEIYDTIQINNGDIDFLNDNGTERIKSQTGWEYGYNSLIIEVVEEQTLSIDTANRLNEVLIPLTNANDISAISRVNTYQICAISQFRCLKHGYHAKSEFSRAKKTITNNDQEIMDFIGDKSLYDFLEMLGLSTTSDTIWYNPDEIMVFINESDGLPSAHSNIAYNFTTNKIMRGNGYNGFETESNKSTPPRNEIYRIPLYFTESSSVQLLETIMDNGILKFNEKFMGYNKDAFVSSTNQQFEYIKLKLGLGKIKDVQYNEDKAKHRRYELCDITKLLISGMYYTINDKPNLDGTYSGELVIQVRNVVEK